MFAGRKLYPKLLVDSTKGYNEFNNVEYTTKEWPLFKKKMSGKTSFNNAYNKQKMASRH